MKTRIIARKTGNLKVTYRWLGDVNGSTVVHAQSHVEAVVDGFDTWTGEIDPRMTRETRVMVPVGLLLINSERVGKAGEHSYSAGIVGVDEAGKTKIDWLRCDHLGTKRVPVDARNPDGAKNTVHTVVVDGQRREYNEAS